MNKPELIERMAEKSELSKKDSESALNAFMQVVEESLVAGEDVKLVGFGNFEVRHRKATTGRNPKNPEEVIEIPASRGVGFKQSKPLKEKMNQ